MEIIGDELWMDGFKVGTLSNDIPPTKRADIEVLIMSLSGEKEQEYQDAIASLEHDLDIERNIVYERDDEIEELKNKISRAIEELER